MLNLYIWRWLTEPKITEEKKKKLEEVYFFETVFCALEKVSYVLHENGMLRDYI